MKKILTLILLAVISNAYGQQTEKWMELLENPIYSSRRLNEQNKISEYIKYDFSELLMPRDDFLGYIGDDFKRIRINYNSITRDAKRMELYHVKGTSLVGGNKCNFKGTITIKQIREYKNMHFGVDDEYKNAGFKAQGVLIGEYLLKENPKQKYPGEFKGIVTMYWYVDKNNNILIDDIEAYYSDSYKNNQYVGVWSEYNKKTQKVCNWGEKRIPFSNDLDIGAAYFYPDPKYHKNGWEDFKRME
jgi:hypothetical protein